MRHLIDPTDFTKEETKHTLNLAGRISLDMEAYQDVAVPENGVTTNVLA